MTEKVVRGHRTISKKVLRHLWNTFTATGYVCAFPDDCYIGSRARFSTQLRVWIHTSSNPQLYATDVLCTMAPLAPITPATINCDQKYSRRHIFDVVCWFIHWVNQHPVRKIASSIGFVSTHRHPIDSDVISTGWQHPLDKSPSTCNCYLIKVWCYLSIG